METISSLKKIECRTCHQKKPINEFVKDKTCKNGYRDECKQCKEKRNKKYLVKWAEERSTKTIPEEKKCNYCHQIKPISDYTMDKHSKDGFSHSCRDCKTLKQQKLVEKWKKERIQNKNIIPPAKRCIKCKQILPVSQFGSNIRSKDGLSNICRKCQKKRTSEYKKRWQEEQLLLQKTGNTKNFKKCPSCGQTLDRSDFYISRSHKDGLSFYCKKCELQSQKKHRNIWESKRTKELVRTPRNKTCNICNKTLPLTSFYKNRAFKDGYSSTCILCEINRQKNYKRKWAETRTKNKNNVEEKECVTCHKILPVSSFYSNIRHKDGFTSSCIDCKKQKQQEYIVKWKSERSKISVDNDFTLFPSFEKKCNICKRVLPRVCFYKKTRSKDGYSSNCIDCELGLAKERRINRKKKHKKIVIPVEKFCKRCQRMLPSSMFHKNCDSSDGLAIYCGECKNKMHKEYRGKPGVLEKLKAYTREYRSRPSVREHERKRARKYSRRPYVKKKRKAYLEEYYSHPEVIERRKIYLRNYYSRPDVKERVRLYYLEYQKKKKTDS